MAAFWQFINLLLLFKIRTRLASGHHLWGPILTHIGYEQFKQLLKNLFVWTLRSQCIATIRLNCASPNFLIYLLDN